MLCNGLRITKKEMCCEIVSKIKAQILLVIARQAALVCVDHHGKLEITSLCGLISCNGEAELFVQKQFIHNLMAA